MIIDLINKL